MWMYLEDTHHRTNRDAIRLILLLLVNTETVIDICALQSSLAMAYDSIVHLPVVDPMGNYSHGYIGVSGK